jgi:hypothetical protein
MATIRPARSAPTSASRKCTQRPLATAARGAPSLTAAWKAIPSWAVVGLEDHIIPAADQRVMANNASAHVTEVKAPHLSMIRRRYRRTRARRDGFPGLKRTVVTAPLVPDAASPPSQQLV